MPAIASRPAETLDDLRVAGAVLSRAWRDGAPFVAAAPGDLDWWFCQAWPAELADRLRLWSADGEVVGWSWLDGSELDWQAWSGDPAVDAEVDRAVLEDAIRAPYARPEASDVLTWSAVDDHGRMALLAAAGFLPDPPRRLSQFQQPAPPAGSVPRDGLLPDGYRIRSVFGQDELSARVEVHRAAFAPSRMTVEKYDRLVGLPHYRFEDDRVVVAPDGTLAAFAIAWWDPVGRIGEFEPVGTHPDDRRRGLGKALLTDAIHRFAKLGARTVQVYSDPDNPASEALYQSVGFRRRAYHVRYRRPTGPSTSDPLRSAG